MSSHAFFRAVTGGTGNWGWVSARAVTGGTVVNGLKCELISIVLSCIVLLILSCSCPAKCDGNTCWEDSVAPRAQLNMVDDTRKVYKSKSSSHFPNFDASNAWQMGHNS